MLAFYRPFTAGVDGAVSVPAVWSRKGKKKKVTETKKGERKREKGRRKGRETLVKLTAG